MLPAEQLTSTNRILFHNFPESYTNLIIILNPNIYLFNLFVIYRYPIYYFVIML